MLSLRHKAHILIYLVLIVLSILRVNPEINSWSLASSKAIMTGESYYLAYMPEGHKRVKLWMAWDLINGGSLEDADLILNEVACDEKNILTCHYIGLLIKEKGNLKTAIEIWSNVNDINSLVRYARVHLGNSEFDEALILLDAAYSLDKQQYAQAYAQALNRVGEVQKAKQTLIEAIESYPDNQNIYLWEHALGQIYLNEAAWDHARELYLRIVEKFQDYDSYLGLAWAYYGGLENQRAREIFKKTLVLDPMAWRSYYGLGLIELREHNYEYAIKWLNLALINSDSQNAASIYYELAWAYRMIQEKDKAIDMIAKAIEKSQTPKSYQFARQGAIYEWAKAYDLALGAYAKALEIDPNNPSAINGLERMRSQK